MAGGRAGRGTPVLIAPKKDTVQAFNNDVEQGDTFDPDPDPDPDLAVAEASVDDYVGLVLPGGTTNPDQLRVDDNAVAFVTAFASAGKPVAAICHAPWTLIEADLVRGKALTSFPSLQTDVRNAGGQWRDAEVVTCPEQGFALVTSRDPDDLEAFCRTRSTHLRAASAKCVAGCKDRDASERISRGYSSWLGEGNAGNGQMVQQRKGLRIHPAR